jgi:hypothetical protein
MNIGFSWSRAVALVVATTPIVALSGYAEANALNAALPGVTIPTPALPPLRTAALNAASTSALANIPFESGPRETLAQCMTYWDAATHMSRVEWRRTCQRTNDGTRF